MSVDLYSVTGVATAIICYIIFHCNEEIHENDDKSRLFGRLLLVYIVFAIVDGLWGLFYSNMIPVGKTGIYVISWIFHFVSCVAAYAWYMFCHGYYRTESGVIKVIGLFPLVAAIVILIVQCISGIVFRIDDNLVYRSGRGRDILFLIQLVYFILAAACGIKFLRNTRDKKNSKYRIIICECIVLLPIVSVLQWIFIEIPCYSVGFMITAVLSFNGTMVIQKAEEGNRYELVSKETYNALSTLAKQYLSVHLFDLNSDKQTMVNSTPEIEYFVKPEDTAHDQIMKVMQGVTMPEYTEEVVKFVDTYTLPERMKYKNSISTEFIGRNVGWCISTFLVASRDEYGEATKVIHTVQCVEEAKKKEAAYTAALTRAYENKNAIYAELMKMQSVGVIAVDDEGYIIIANDMAVRMFGHDGEDVVGMRFAKFWDIDTMSEDAEVARGYARIRKDGGTFMHNLTLPGDGDEDKRFLMADAKKIELLDGSEIMIICYTDITKSKRLEEKLRVLSEMDALTGVDNRRSGERRTENLLRLGVGGLYCLLDVNKFKSINDTYGHKIGDDVLVAVAKALKDSFRNDDIVMRLGGDEFAIFAKSVSNYDLAKKKINRIFENLEAIDIEGIPKNTACVSLGAILVSANNGVIEDNLATIYRKADALMYTCKGKSGNNMNLGIEQIGL